MANSGRCYSKDSGIAETLAYKSRAPLVIQPALFNLGYFHFVSTEQNYLAYDYIKRCREIADSLQKDSGNLNQGVLSLMAEKIYLGSAEKPLNQIISKDCAILADE